MQKKVIKTDLALINEAKTKVKELTQAVNKFGDETRDIISAKSRLSKKIQSAKDNVKKSKKIVERYAKELKDLGIDNEPQILRNLRNAIIQAEKTALRFENDFLSN